LALALFFSFAWPIINNPYFMELEAGESSAEEIFQSIFLTGSGYYSITEYILFFPLILLFACEFAIGRERSYLIVRAQSPSHNHCGRVIVISVVALIFVLLHSMVGAAFVLYRFGAELASSFRFAEHTLYILCALFLCYLRLGIVYTLIKDATRRPLLSKAMLIAICWLEYQIGKWCNIAWLPCYDIANGYDIITGRLAVGDAMLALPRQALLVLLAWVISRQVYINKDFLKDE
jgi:hypothetical protein